MGGKRLQTGHPPPAVLSEPWEKKACGILGIRMRMFCMCGCDNVLLFIVYCILFTVYCLSLVLLLAAHTAIHVK